MKNAVLALLGVGLMIGSGCSSTSMKMRAMNQDIPAALVAQYKASDMAYGQERRG